MSGRRLVTELRLDSGAAGTTLARGAGAIVFMDVAYRPGRPSPKRLTHSVSVSYTAPGARRVTNLGFVGVPTAVGQSTAIKIAPPLRGPGWVDLNRCCATITSHRGAVVSVNGGVSVSERFAIDFIQLDAMDRLLTGPADQLSSYAFVGASVYAVADGTVVATHVGEPDRAPGTGPAPETVTIQNAGGNYIVIKIAPGGYAFYAHLQLGSLRVRTRQHVKTGQIIALLGNSGRSTLPPFPSSDELPVAGLERPAVRVRLVPRSWSAHSHRCAGTGGRAQINSRSLTGPHRGQLPLNKQVINLG